MTKAPRQSIWIANNGNADERITAGISNLIMQAYVPPEAKLKTVSYFQCSMLFTLSGAMNNDICYLTHNLENI